MDKFPFDACNCLDVCERLLYNMVFGGGMTDDVLNPTQVAQLLGVSVRTLERRVKTGKVVPARRLTPQATYWLRSDLEAYLGKKEDDEDLS